MRRRCSLIVTVLIACCLCIIGCNGGGDARKDAESRIVGHWVALNLMLPDGEGHFTSTPIPDGLYFDIAPGGTFTITFPSDLMGEGAEELPSTFLGTWKYRAQVDPKANAGFEYEFDGSFPTADGGEGGKAAFLLGELSGGTVPNNPDALTYYVRFGETALQGLASIDGRTSPISD